MSLRSDSAVFGGMSYVKRNSFELAGEIRLFYSLFSIIMLSLSDFQVIRFCYFRTMVLGVDTEPAKYL